MANIKPIGDRVLIEREPLEEHSEGGIFLPDNARQKPQVGKVLAVGTGKMLKDGTVRPLQVKPGERVYFTSWAGDEYKSKEKKLLLMREDEILAVMD